MVKWLFALLCVLVGSLLTSSTVAATHQVSALGPQIFSTSLGLEDGSVVALDVDGKGRTLVVTATRNRRTMRISRVTVDGSFDSSFGTAGHVEVDLTEPLSGIFGAFFPSALAIDDEDRVVLVGRTSVRAAVMRIDVDGLFDETFGDDGVVSFDFGGRSPSFADVAVGRDGTLFAVGSIDHTAGFTNMVVAKIGNDGRIDASFGDGGIVSIDVDRTGGWDDAATSVALRRDGGIVVAGNKAWVAGGVDTAVVQLLGDGRFDEGFGDNGIVRVLRSSDEFLLNRDPDVAIGRDGRIVVTAERLGGSVGGGTVLVRMLDDGSIDRGFGEAGIVLLRSGPPQGTLALTSDGRILFQGQDVTWRFGIDGTLETGPRVTGLTGVRGARLHWDRSGWLTTVGDSVRRWEFPTAVPGTGFWLVDGVGAAYDFGEAVAVEAPGAATTGPVVGAASTGANGYLLLSANGAVAAEGDAVHLGDATDVGLNAEETWVAIAATPGIQGYWLFSNLGRVNAYGDATQLGDLLGLALDEPIVSGVSTPDGRGYMLLGRDGGVFAFGDARFSGSLPAMLGAGDRLDAPSVAMALTRSGNGYWIVGADGGVFAFGDAPFLGSIPGVLPPGTTVSGPIIDVAVQPGGYALFGSDGGVFAFGNVPFVGSLGGTRQIGPIVAAIGLREPTPVPAAPTLEVQGIALCSELDQARTVEQEVLDEVFNVADLVRPALTDDGLVRSVEPSQKYGAVEVEVRNINSETAAEVRRRVGSFRLCLSGPESRRVGVQVQPGLRMADRVDWLDPGEILVAARQPELDALVAASPSGFDVSSVDLSREVVVAIGLGVSPACPPIVSGIEGELSTRVTFEIDLPGYRSCWLPVSSSTFVVRVDRGLLATGDIVFVHPGSGAEAEARIESLGAPRQVVEGPPEPIVVDRGVVSLPAPGQTRLASLADGTPVFVVRHDDGGVSVIDPRVAASNGAAGEALASWVNRSRRFIAYVTVTASGVWDEYGQSLDVGPRNDLARHLVELTADGKVRVGQRSIRRQIQEPITGTIDSRGGRLIRVMPSDSDSRRRDDAQAAQPFVDLDMSADEDGLWLTRSDGSVEARGTARHLGDRPRLGPAETVVALVATPNNEGYWLISSSGRVDAYGDAPELGDVSDLVLGGAIVDAAAAPSGMGYYLLGSDGGVFGFGTAPYLGSIPELVDGRSPTTTATAMATVDGGYAISTADGALFVFGRLGASLPVFGLAGATETEIVDIEFAEAADGYRLLGADGGVFSYGTRLFRGSAAGVTTGETVAIVSRDDGSGYLVLDRDGSVWAFGDARNIGVERFSGVGTTAIDVDIVGSAIVYAASDRDDLWLGVLDSEGAEQSGLRFNLQRVPGFNLLDVDGVETLVVNTAGSWTIEILPPTYARIWRPSEGELSGAGNDVVRVVEPLSGDLEVDGGSDLGVLVRSVGSDDRYRLDQTFLGRGDLRGPVPRGSGPSLVALTTSGDWSIGTATTRSAVQRAIVSAPCRDTGDASFAVSLDLGEVAEIPDGVTLATETVATRPRWALSGAGFDTSSVSVALRGVSCADTAGRSLATLNVTLSNGEFVLVDLVVRPVTLIPVTCTTSTSGDRTVVGQASLSGFKGFEGFDAGVAISSAAAVGVSAWVEGPVSVDAGGLIAFEFTDGTGRPCPPEGFIVGQVLADLSNGDRVVAYITAG